MHAGARRAGAELYLAHGDGRQSGSAVTLSAHGIQIATQLRRHGLATELGIRHSGGGAGGAFYSVRSRWSLTSTKMAARTLENQISPLRFAPVEMTPKAG